MAAASVPVQTQQQPVEFRGACRAERRPRATGTAAGRRRECRWAPPVREDNHAAASHIGRNAAGRMEEGKRAADVAQPIGKARHPKIHPAVSTTCMSSMLPCGRALCRSFPCDFPARFAACGVRPARRRPLAGYRGSCSASPIRTGEGNGTAPGRSTPDASASAYRKSRGVECPPLAAAKYCANRRGMY